MTLQLVPLTRNYRQRLLDLGVYIGAQLALHWDELGSWDDADVERFIAAVTPTVDNAQSTAASLAAAYLGLALGSQVTIDTTKLTAPDLRGPFTAYWGKLADTGDWRAALQSGRTSVEQTGITAVRTAASEASIQVDEKEPRITGWQRVVDAGACDWCVMVAGQRYGSAETATFGHNGCGCYPIPIIGEANPARVLNATTASDAMSPA